MYRKVCSSFFFTNIKKEKIKLLTKSTKQLIEDARVLGGVYNSDFTNFQISTSLLNDIYRSLYDDLTEEGSFFVDYYDFTGNETELPRDCYRVLNVYRKEGERFKPLRANSADQYIENTYYIENSNLYINCKAEKEYRIRYSKLPMTLTCPDDPIKSPRDISPTEWGLMTEDGVYFKENGKSYYWDFKAETIEEKAFKPVSQPYYFLGKDLIINKKGDKVTSMLWGNTEVEDIIDYFTIEGLDIKSVVVSDPYIFVNYSNNHIMVYNGFKGTEWNILISTGKPTLGKIVAAHTNDSTGKGVIYYNAYTQSYYLASFVPDTVLSYPTNAFFSLIEYKLSALLMSMVGLGNEYLISKLIPEAEETFYKTLRKDGYSPVRISNVYGG